MNTSINVQKRKKCPNGTRKNKKTGLCEPKEKIATLKKTTTSKRQTRSDAYYPKTRIRKIYARKEKSQPKIQTKLTQYLKPVVENFESRYFIGGLNGLNDVIDTSDNSYSALGSTTSGSDIADIPTYPILETDRNKSEFAKKMATKRIAQFMNKPEVQEKRTGAFLKSICSDSNVCIAFGIEDNKIQQFFNGFTNFQYVVAPIKRIGEKSINGFVNEIMYERNNYIAYAVLKSSQRSDAGNLFYEYIVGKYLNKMSVYYPCFLKTYGIYQYTNIDDYNTMKDNITINNTDILKRGLEKVNISEPPSGNDFLSACKISQYISILSQHVKNATMILKFTGIHPYFLLYQIYFTLHCMRKNYTHYDLHCANVLCYNPGLNNYIHFMYHLNNGEVVDFVCSYLAYIIDNGMCYFYENKQNSTRVIYDKICAARCPTRCGEKQGFRVLNNAIAAEDAGEWVSADLRLLRILVAQGNISLSEKIVPVKKNKSGLNDTPRVIHNVTDALQVMSEKVAEFKDQMMQYVNSNGYTKLGTMHVYENGTTPARFEKV
jgi:hypothetical protein